MYLPLLHSVRPFPRSRARRALYAVTGGGDVADSPGRVDIEAIRRSHRTDTQASHRRAPMPPNQLQRIANGARTRSALLAEGVRGNNDQGVDDGR